MRLALVLVLLLSAAAPAKAQPSWTWTADAAAFAGMNVQDRTFTDFTSVESQNWFMVDGEHHAAAGALRLTGMLSLEPFTMKRLGSSQVFQTGEAYHGAPLIDYQHPHDLITGLGAAYTVRRAGVAYTVEADVVGSPALGPTAFMHRASARNNPQAPLTHHALDSTHVTPGVLRAALSHGHATADASFFTGREPNDNHVNIDRPRLDSWSGRLAWHSGGLRVQFSGGRIHAPDFFEPYDVTRLTASAEWSGHIHARAFAATVAWGENREFHGNLDGYLAEWDWAPSGRDSIYGRAESTARDVLDLGAPAPAGFPDFHRISHVDALTTGYVHNVARGRFGQAGVGADLTLYRVSRNLQDSYGAPRSFHVFVRWRARHGAMEMAMN